MQASDKEPTKTKTVRNQGGLKQTITKKTRKGLGGRVITVEKDKTTNKSGGLDYKYKSKVRTVSNAKTGKIKVKTKDSYMSSDPRALSEKSKTKSVRYKDGSGFKTERIKNYGDKTITKQKFDMKDMQQSSSGPKKSTTRKFGRPKTGEMKFRQP